MSVKKALEVRFDSEAGEDLSVRQYFHELLRKLWDKQDRFDGKRPFGNSDWDYDIYFALAKAGLVDLGPLGDDGEPYNWTDKQINLAHAYVHDLISAALVSSEVQK